MVRTVLKLGPKTTRPLAEIGIAKRAELAAGAAAARRGRGFNGV